MRSSSSTHGPKPVPAPVPAVTSDIIIKDLDDQIKSALHAFHRHSKECKPCRNPIQLYQKRQKLCGPGQDICEDVMVLLYDKAKLVPKGRFRVEYKQGWEAVDGLIRMITLANQGHASNEVLDLERAVSASKMIEKRPRDRSPVEYVSSHDLDKHESTRGHRRQHRVREASPTRKPKRQATYPDPRTSLLDAPTGRTQASHGLLTPPHSPKAPSHSPKSTPSSPRQVRWDDDLEKVRYFTTESNS